MNRHEGVTCNFCMENDFVGRRYKCLICHDIDLCADCYESGETNTTHTTGHPVQCFLTSADYQLYYGGESLGSTPHPQSYTCPHCAKMGYTEFTLKEHVFKFHVGTVFEVLCPLCVAVPGGDSNRRTNDFASHLMYIHRSEPYDFLIMMNEMLWSRFGKRTEHTGLSSTPRLNMTSGPMTITTVEAPNLSRNSNNAPVGLNSRPAEGAASSSEVSFLPRETIQYIPGLLFRPPDAAAQRQMNSTTNDVTNGRHVVHSKMRKTNTLARCQPEKDTENQTGSSGTSTSDFSASSQFETPAPQFLLKSLQEESTEIINNQVLRDRRRFIQELIFSSLNYPLKTEKSSDILTKPKMEAVSLKDHNESLSGEK